MSLPWQGELMHCASNPAAAIWAKVVARLSSGSMKFVSNAATDTLPHNCNLVPWGKLPTSSGCCKLCGEQQSLCHVLNHCSVAQNLRHYNHRHDAVLKVIADMVESNLAPNQCMTVDLPGNNYLFPQHIGRTESRLDLVVWEDDTRMVTVVELTICFESNFNDAQRHKTLKCAELLEEVEHSDYCGSLITIEVDSCGLLHMEGLDHFQNPMRIESHS